MNNTSGKENERKKKSKPRDFIQTLKLTTPISRLADCMECEHRELKTLKAIGKPAADSYA